MPFERHVLLAIHAHASPFLDAVFRFSHVLGTLPFCAILVLCMALLHARRGERRDALLWLLAGIGAGLVQATLKDVFERDRPLLWPRIGSWPQAFLWLRAGDPAIYSFPSGHALATAALFPLAAHSLARIRPKLARPAWIAAILLVLFVSFGRLYLGVHWPSDVLAGWLLGGTLAALAIRVRERAGR